MGGVNPYIVAPNAPRPEKPYRVTFKFEDGGEPKTVTVDPAAIPYASHGLEGSILDIAEGCGVEINHSCGGVCACSTCHVHVLEGAKSCNETSEEEDDELEEAYDLKPSSRLGCQCVPDGTMTVKIRIPNWNRNLAREAKSAPRRRWLV